MSIISDAMVREALGELSKKSEEDIEFETALKWGARAIASYEMFVRTMEGAYFLNGEEFYHEALEHAALVRDRGKLVAQIQDQVDTVRLRTTRIYRTNK